MNESEIRRLPLWEASFNDGAQWDTVLLWRGSLNDLGHELTALVGRAWRARVARS